MIDTSARLSAALAGRYRLEREYGAGGMATVWLAYDLKHDRQVAVKVLHPHLAAVVGAERFLKEIKTTANLQHPHILPLFDSGDAEGLLFYVMPFVDGESLRQRITREKQLPIADAVRITSEVASALDYAHRHGVIHRDIKPENILLHEGSALVADFGIALASDRTGTRLTQTGMSIGTPPYMSPEQALGERQLDARSDVYAVGAMLYEMLTGTPPFTGASMQAIMAKVITEKPVPPSRLRREIPVPVEDAVLTALQKDPADRFPTAQALQSALEHGGPTRTRRKPTPQALALAAVGLVIILAGGAYFATHQRRTGDSPLALSIAAVPFRTQDSADAYLGNQIPQEILDQLTHIPGLTVRPLASAPRFRNDDNPAGIARALGVGILLTGSVDHRAKSIRITARRYDAARNQSLDAVMVEDNADNTFAVEDSVTATIVSGFKLTQSRAQLAVSRARRTTNPAAHDLYLRGLFFFGKRTCADIRKGIDYFEQAIEADSLYASAYSGLTDASSVLAILGCVRPTDGFPQAEKAARRAIQLDSTLAEAHTSLGIVDIWYSRDRPAAYGELSRALAIDPQYSPAHLFLGWYLAYGGDTTQAIAEFQRARELDPLSVILTTRVGSGRYYARRYAEAIGWLRKALELDSTAVMPHAEMARAWLQLRNCDSALAEASFIPPKFPNFEGAIAGYALAACGHRREAEQMLGDLKERAKHEFVFAIKIAQLYLGLGERDSAFAWLERARDQHEPFVPILKMDPWYDSLRGDPRFARLLSPVGQKSGN